MEYILGVWNQQRLTYKTPLPQQMAREIADLKQASPKQADTGPALPASVIDASFGMSLICQQPLYPLYNWDTPPGAAGQDPT